jgi:ketosteroid isomerase-like protein
VSYLSSKEVIQGLLVEFGKGKDGNVLQYFTEDAVWVRPGPAIIPFAGTFKGIGEIEQMFVKTAESVVVDMHDAHAPEVITKGAIAVLIGEDTSTVLSTKKTYHSEYVIVFEIRKGKITKAQTYLDTALIADAFTK